MLGTHPRARCLAWSLALVLGTTPLAARARIDGAAPGARRLAEARQAIQDGRPAAAIDALEAALASSPALAGDDKAATLGLLRDAYEAAAKEAEKAGRPRDAESLREDARIIARRVKTTSPAPTASASSVSASPASTPAPAAPRDEPEPPIEPAPASAAMIGPTTPPVLAPLDPEPPASPAVESPAVSAPPSRLAPPAAEPTWPGMTEADAAFTAKRYAEAGAIYAKLAASDRLPAERRDHWAYCRSAEVARRIGTPPRSEAEWRDIDAEIEQIRALAPDNWLGDYLRNKASARHQARRVARNGGGMVVRGAAPEEGPPRGFATPDPARAPVPTTTPASAPTPTPRVGKPTDSPAPNAASAAVPAPATSVPSAAGRPAVAPVGRWQSRESANFRVFHHNPKLAEQVVQIAEATRRNQIQRWTGKLPAAPWQPKCEIYLFPTAAQYAQMTGQPTDSPGFSTMGMNQGTVITRRVSLRTDHEGLLHAVLPHEVTHVILADFFPDQQIPRWADEGIAVLTEPVAEQDRRATDLVEPLKKNVLFEIDKLMSMDYPDNDYWSLYYAQSVSLTRFLVEQGTPAQFIQFLQGSQKRGFDAELRRTYKIDGASDLQGRWIAYARGQATARPSSPEARVDPAAATASATPHADRRVR